jgi:hypothetical protein
VQEEDEFKNLMSFLCAIGDRIYEVMQQVQSAVSDEDRRSREQVWGVKMMMI